MFAEASKQIRYRTYLIPNLKLGDFLALLDNLADELVAADEAVRCER